MSPCKSFKSESTVKSRNFPCGLAQPNQCSDLIIMMPLAELGSSDWLVTSVIDGEGDFLLLGLGCLETGTLYQIETDWLIKVSQPLVLGLLPAVYQNSSIYIRVCGSQDSYCSWTLPANLASVFSICLFLLLFGLGGMYSLLHGHF